MKNFSLRILAILLASVTLSSCLAGKFMCNYSLTPKPHGVEDIERTRHKADSLLPGSTAWYDGLKQQGILKDTVITGYNYKQIHACYAPAKDPASAQGTAIVVHGYSDNHVVFLYLVRMYRDEFNYNVLFPDLQYHGYSEGDAIQMGWHDRYDVEEWARVAHDIFRNDFTVVHGVSMGGATVMMMSGDPQPYYIRAFVEDCGYSTVYDQFAHNLKQMFPFIPKDVLNSANYICEKRYGWGFKEASSVSSNSPTSSATTTPRPWATRKCGSPPAPSTPTPTPSTRKSTPSTSATSSRKSNRCTSTVIPDLIGDLIPYCE